MEIREIINELHIEAAKALGKQIPMKPIEAQESQKLGGYKHRCPVCDTAVGRFDKKQLFVKQILHERDEYCSECGQKLDWSE